jgi:3-hydroxyisobutyrate dehydrogenase-like beta-hydroxyacid dehydrogenase
MNVGFVGLGRMGQGMAARLQSDGHDLRVFDPVPSHTESLVTAGAIAASSPADASEGQDVIITMLPTDAILNAVLTGDGGLINDMAPSCIHMAMGTHGVPATNAANKLHQTAGQTFVACPVLGRPDLAAEGLLTLVPGGPADAVDIVRPLLKMIGQRNIEVGEDPQAAAAVKIANNFVLGCAIETMGEAFSLVEKLGVAPEQFLDVMLKGLFGAPAYEVYGKMIVDKAWVGRGATAVIGLKDADLALEAAEAAGVPLPSAHIWRDYLAEAVELGEGHLDWAVMALQQARASGLENSDADN